MNLLRTNRALRLLTLAAVIALALIAVPAALAQDGQPPVPDDEVTYDEVNAIAKELYCPVCENVPLDVCETQACADWRDEIRTMLAEGRSEQDIFDYFSGRYGQRVLATPQREGFDLLVWLLPPLGVLAGAVVLIAALRRMAPGALDAQAEPAAAVTYDDLDPEYVARLERELQEFAG